MSFSLEAGYIPASIEDLMALVRENINTEFEDQLDTPFTAETFLGTNFYKFFYALIQKLQLNEVKTSEIVLKLQQYFDVTNELITRPNTTHPGLLDIFTAAGYVVSTKKPIEADAGKLYLCADVDDGADDYASVKLEINTILKDSVAAGIVTMGTETSTIAISNAQSFDWKFYLPDEHPIELRLTLDISDNNQFAPLTDDAVRQLLFDNINARYRLGLNFEPQRYFSVVDAPWAASVLLEYSLDGISWLDDIYVANFDDKLTFVLGDISVVNT